MEDNFETTMDKGRKKTKRIKYLNPRTGIVHTIKKGGCVYDTWILLDN